MIFVAMADVDDALEFVNHDHDLLRIQSALLLFQPPLDASINITLGINGPKADLHQIL